MATRTLVPPARPARIVSRIIVRGPDGGIDRVIPIAHEDSPEGWAIFHSTLEVAEAACRARDGHAAGEPGVAEVPDDGE